MVRWKYCKIQRREGKKSSFQFLFLINSSKNVQQPEYLRSIKKSQTRVLMMNYSRMSSARRICFQKRAMLKPWQFMNSTQFVITSLLLSGISPANILITVTSPNISTTQAGAYVKNSTCKRPRSVQMQTEVWDRRKKMSESILGF